MTFGEKIRELRKAKRLTLRDLADRVGVGFTYLSKIENHKLEEGHGPSHICNRHADRLTLITYL